MCALRALLLFVALLGLAGQATAMVTMQPITSSPATASNMAEGCMEMTADDEDSQSKPCDGTFDCMLAMGCLSLAATAEVGSAEVDQQIEATQRYWPAVAILHGANFAPEPDPPTAFD